MDSRSSLPVNTILDGSYRILRVVGSGGFGITYEAEDTNLGTLVAIKEYYPCDFGDRDATMSVRPKSDRHAKTFQWGRSNFLQEARTLARFEHPSIVRVTRVFEANSTAYMVMRFEQGQSFEDWLRGLGRLPSQDELDAIVAPLLDALQMMHAENFLHRDIAPDNIIVRADGSPVLLDFGASRRAVAEVSRTLTGIVKAGYSPHEQYTSDNRLQGPWSDLYALGGTLYRAVTGHPPEEATLRVDEDHMPPAAQAARKSGYRPGFLTAIDASLKVRHSERPRSVAQLRPMILGRKSQPRIGLGRIAGAFKVPSEAPQKTPSNASSRPGQPPRSHRQQPMPPPEQMSVRRWPAIAAAILAIMGGAYGGYEYTRWEPAASIELATAKKLADAAVAKKRVDDDQARLEARQHADIASAQKRVAEQRAREEADARAKQQADAAAKNLAEERARQEAEAKAKQVADADAARKKADEEAQAKREEAERSAAEARRQAGVDKSKIEDPNRVAGETLNEQERATFVKKVQAALKHGKCYEGDINGSSDDAQNGLDRYVSTARRMGKERPGRIELAKATVSDFEDWLRDADNIKDGICLPSAGPKFNRPARERAVSHPPARERATEHSSPRQRAAETPSSRQRSAERTSPRPQPSYSERPSYSGGGGGYAPIQGIQ